MLLGTPRPVHRTHLDCGVIRQRLATKQSSMHQGITRYPQFPSATWGVHPRKSLIGRLCTIFLSLTRRLDRIRPLQMISQTVSLPDFAEHHDRLIAKPVYREKRMAPLNPKKHPHVLAVSPLLERTLRPYPAACEQLLLYRVVLRPLLDRCRPFGYFVDIFLWRNIIRNKR